MEGKIQQLCHAGRSYSWLAHGTELRPTGTQAAGAVGLVDGRLARRLPCVSPSIC